MIVALFFLFGIQDWQSYTNTNAINDLVATEGKIYCATHGGLSIFSLTEEDFIETFTNTEGLAVNQCHCLALDKDSNLWIGTLGGGISVFSPTTKKFSTYPYNRLPESKITTIAAAGDTILVGSANGLYVVVPNQPVLRFTHLQGLLSDNILSLGVGDFFWVGTDKGINRINRKLDSVYSYTKTLGLGGDSAMAIVVSDSVYVATESGIAYFTNTRFETLTVFPTKMAIRDLVQSGDTFYIATDKGGYCYEPSTGLTQILFSPPDVRALVDKDGIWFGLGGNEYYGYGLWRYPQKTLFKADCIRSNSMEGVLTDTAGGIWVCHGWPPHRQGISFRDTEGHWHYFSQWPLAGARIGVRDSKNRLWFGCWWFGDHSWSPDSVAGVARFEPEKNKWTFFNWGNYSPMNVIGAIGVDSYDRVWLTHYGQEVLSVIDTTGTIHTIASSPAFVFGRGIDFDPQGRVWIASRGGGLVMIDHKNTISDPSDDLLTLFTVASGLPSLEVTSVSVDRNGRVWFGTEKGLGLYTQNRFYLYTKTSTSNGLAADYVIQVRTDTWGDVWCLTTGGLSVYHPYENRWTSYLPQNSGMIPQADYQNDYTGLVVDDANGFVLIGSKNSGLSRFAFRPVPPPELDSIGIHPNPFIPASGHQRIIFDRLPENAKIKIYTLNGELLTTLAPDPNRLAQAWEPSPRIASGIYLVVITTPTKKRITKIVIVK